MSRKIAESIRRSLMQALAYVEGTADLSQYRVHAPKIDVRAIRGKLGMTQKEFAQQFLFNVHTLRGWERYRHAPSRHIRAYLLVIDRAPKAVQKALRAV